MVQQQKKGLNSPCSILALMLTFMVFFLPLIIRDIYSNLRRRYLQPLLRRPCTARIPLFGLEGSCKNPDLKAPQSQEFPAQESQVGRILDGKTIDEVKLSGVEVRLVMERLGIVGNPEEGADGPQLQEGVGAAQIAGLFDEQEPSLEEVKEAFDVFDKNHDGFIDASELCSFLRSFGFLNLSESICRDMIRAFDNNGDGLIDLREFMKLVEKSLH
ncbi:probable calcium-binding protein CML30 [Punica granatum]|uniref:EF-hand domain-containing protein n=2 Tax=Punica granatum TaxID=22663 RepID=A0A218XZ80_PUNGR|nr:probable calcium-binding protein CML30 [Punica granatum]OWM90405.1 hypothetical protein CDL15_Pgr014708 [Punica granatum]PKI77978.1 hypothetical protein CRG98_001598 [Punica granatum]